MRLPTAILAMALGCRSGNLAPTLADLGTERAGATVRLEHRVRDALWTADDWIVAGDGSQTLVLDPRDGAVAGRLATAQGRPCRSTASWSWSRSLWGTWPRRGLKARCAPRRLAALGRWVDPTLSRVLHDDGVVHERRGADFVAIPLREPLRRAAISVWSADGSRVFAAFLMEAGIWDARTGERLAAWETLGTIEDAALSWDGREAVVATIGADTAPGEARTWRFEVLGQGRSSGRCAVERQPDDRLGPIGPRGDGFFVLGDRGETAVLDLADCGQRWRAAGARSAGVDAR